VLPALVEIFRWDLDFFRDLHRGDRFRVLLERRVRADGSLRGARVIAAEIVRQGSTHRAVWFDGTGEGDYFDLSGNPMRRAFLRSPIDYRRITSRFTQSRRHPILGRWRAHLGTDYGAAPGTPVHAVADGIVTHAGFWGGYGRAVELRHPTGIRTRYAHLGGIPKAIAVGRSVRQGDLLGWVGSSGLASGPHLHYEMIVGGRAVDPRKVSLPAGEPLPDSVRTSFGVARDALWLRLEQTTPLRASAARTSLR
jgi:murein DD-endopeptidase MepM/ murein hydrolase activator NlpD